MTVEHLWFNNKIIKGLSLDNKTEDQTIDYRLDDVHFDLLWKCAVMNSTAVFTISLPNNILDQLEKQKQTDP